MFKSILSVLILICYFSYAKALSIDELKQTYVKMIMECANEFPITANDLEILKNKKMPENESVKCLFACVYKRAGMMSEEGKLWIEGVNEMSRKYLSDEPSIIKKSEEFTEACKDVNDVAVSDGNKGCERAALIFKCTVEKAPFFDFV